MADRVANLGERTEPVMWIGADGNPLILGSGAYSRKDLQQERIKFQQIVDSTGTPITEIPGGGGGGGGGGDNRANITHLGGDMEGFNAAVIAARSYDIPVTADWGTQVEINGYVDASLCHIDLKYTQIFFGENLGAALATETYDQRPYPTTVNSTYDVRGPALEIGGNPGTDQMFEKCIRVNGNYNGDGLKQSTPFTAIRVNGAQRAVDAYDIGLIRHRGHGVEIYGDTEKKHMMLRFDHLYDGYAVTFHSQDTSSGDELVMDIVGTALDGIIFVQDALQISARFNMAVETVTPTGGKYAIESGGRKAETYCGEVRGVSGQLFHHETRFDGESVAGAVLGFDWLIVQHYQGNIKIVNAKAVYGRIMHHQVHTNRDGEGIPNLASFEIGEVEEAVDFSYMTRRNVSPVGARIGISDHINPDGSIGSGFNNKDIRLYVKMGSDEGSTPPQTDPNTLIGVDLDMGDGSRVYCGYLEGNIRIRKGWQNGYVEVPAKWVRSGGSVSTEVGFATEMMVIGPMSFGEVLAISWKFKGLKIQTVADMNGASMYYDGIRWHINTPLSLPAVSFEALGSPFNDPLIKGLGLTGKSLADWKSYIATGSADSSDWRDGYGAVITPNWLTLTDDFESRIVADGGSAFPSVTVKKIYDRLIHDLLASEAFLPSDLTNSPIIGLHMLCGPDEPSALNNVLGSHWKAAKVGTMVHETYRGFKPPNPNGGSYLVLSTWPGDQKGLTRNNISLGACAEELNGAGNTYQTVGTNASSVSMVLHRGDGGNSMRLGAVSAVAYPALIPVHVPPRMGIGWTSSPTSQTMRMYGGPEITAAKTDSGATISNIYYFRALSNYLPFRLSFGVVGSGQNWTTDKLQKTLDALALARKSLRAQVP